MPKPAAKATSAQWAIVVGVGVLLLVGAGYVTYKMVINPPPKILETPYVPPEIRRLPPEPESKVALAPRPLRLFHEFIPAVAAKDRKTVTKLSELNDAKLDALLTDERAEILTMSLQSKRYAIDKQDIKDDTAKFVATFQSSRGLDVMRLVLDMKRNGGPEDWQVTQVADQWYSPSNHPAESQPVALGADRRFALAPKHEESGFKMIPEAEPKTQDWLPNTTDPQKAEIEKCLKQMEDEQHPAVATKASQELINMGKVVIPRLLNELMKLDPKKDEENKRANTIDRTLSALTTLEMGYDVGEIGNLIPPLEARRRAIRRWFGWWEAHKGDPLARPNAPPEDK